jgi:hypothetical protein
MKTSFTSALVMLLLVAMAMPANAQRRDRPSSILTFTDQQNAQQGPREGDGIMVGGQLWDTVKPMNSATMPHDPAFAAIQANRLVVLGADLVDWQKPVGVWPGGYDQTDNWRNGRRMAFPLFKADGWQGYAAGNPLKARDDHPDNRFMFAWYTPNVAGANDANRNYSRTARFTNNNRTHLVYEAGWPTTAGIDFKLRAHQYTMNEQNLNDFVVVEISLHNTGNVDINGNGTVDYSNNRIDGVAALMQALPTHTVTIGRGGDRSTNNFGAGRTFGYFATPDATGAPYDIIAWYPNVPPDRTTNRATPAAGRRLMGVNDGATLRGYQDRWNGFRWMGVKQGGIGSNLQGPTRNAPNKQTIFGTHPVGEGPQRGWYTSSQWRSGLASLVRSDLAFRAATATWYTNWGKTSTTIDNSNTAPNPAFFSGGTAGDVTTFVPGNTSARPNGDYKYASEDISKAAGLPQPVWEDMLNPRAASGNFYDGAVGFNLEYTFGEAMIQGIGPFSLEVGETITMSIVIAAGYRFEGLWNAVQAAEWAWERGWDINSALPVPPAPDVMIESTPNGTALVRWTDVSGIGNQMDGYKVWRSAQYQRQDWLDGGFRLLDRYHHQHTVGADKTPFKRPVNPYFDAAAEFASAIQGTYQPAEWGTYELIAKIPANQLSQYQTPQHGTYQFAFEDDQSITGFTYWYYVSSYREGTFTGPRGAVPVNHIESANFNRNGRNSRDAAPGTIGLATPWVNTYPHADLHPQFPQRGTVNAKNIGKAFTVVPPVAEVDRVAELITVTPNPYKLTGLNDDRNRAESHWVSFLNTPTDFRITIVDVAGTVVYQQTVNGATDGRYGWDMFSKDGVEVASGLYIYHIAYGTNYEREVVGHFAILR